MHFVSLAVPLKGRKMRRRMILDPDVREEQNVCSEESRMPSLIDVRGKRKVRRRTEMLPVNKPRCRLCATA